MFYDLKRDKLEQQLQRDAELKRKQAATSVQAWWRGYRWVAFIVLHSRSCLQTKIVLSISDLWKTIPSSAQGNLIIERRGLRYMYLVLTWGGGWKCGGEEVKNLFSHMSPIHVHVHVVSLTGLGYCLNS